MNVWRVSFGALLIAFVAAPILAPFGGLFDPAVWQWDADDVDRLVQLSLNSLTLCAGTLGLSLSVGTALALLLFRTSFFLRRVLLFLLTLTLFLPLPLLVASWQALLGTGARPWATGLAPAIWIHALAALPWVAFIVGVGLMWIEPELEEEAAQSVGAWRVLAFVTLPRARASILAAALFVVLQTAGETNVTDILQVPTLAEEMRAQFVSNQSTALARTLLLSAPVLLLTWGAMLALLAYLERRLPPLALPPRTPFNGGGLDLGIGAMRFVSAWLMLACLFVPVAGLIWKLGLTGHPPQWDAGAAWHFLRAESIVQGENLGLTLATSLATGVFVAAVALVGCWLARDAAWFRWLFFSVLTWAWVLPGPAVGIGLHGLILEIVAWSPDGLLAQHLYRRPSPLPIIWVQSIRVLPIAVVFLWPVVRRIPRDWFEEARLAGAGPFGEFWRLIWPVSWRVAAVTALAASALSLGEIAASGRVCTPGWMPFPMMLLDRLHYGVENSLAALNLLFLASVAVLALAAFALGKVIGGLFVPPRHQS